MLFHCKPTSTAISWRHVDDGRRTSRCCTAVIVNRFADDLTYATQNSAFRDAIHIDIHPENELVMQPRNRRDTLSPQRTQCRSLRVRGSRPRHASVACHSSVLEKHFRSGGSGVTMQVYEWGYDFGFTICGKQRGSPCATAQQTDTPDTQTDTSRRGAKL